MTIAGLLIPAATILTMSAVSCLTEAGQAGISNPGPHGLSEILYGFASGVGNNGSAFAGLGANSLWYNVLIVGALTFLPALALGPIVDQLFMLQGKVF